MSLRSTAETVDYFGKDIGKKEALKLFEMDIHDVGRIADEIRRQKCGDLVTFVIDTNINYTNVCVSKCRFCAFYARNGGYVLPYEEILKRIGEAANIGATQIMLQGGLNPELGIEWFEVLFRKIKERYPGVHIHSLSPPEIVFLAKTEKMSEREVLERLKSAGLDSLPGGGAEILVDEVRRRISPNKCSSEEWLRVMETAHKMGIPTTATMMFGHVESNKDILDHLLKLRELQKKTGGFTAFIPWTFQPGNTDLYCEIKRPVSPLRYLQVLAISRIVLHNFRNIQASWLTQGFDIATLSLFFGANDFGGTMLEENVVKATGKAFRPARVDEIVKAVKAVGRPVALRDTYYKILEWF
ncbi:cyclic dehypoxanthinyl futalosine synthase [Archaeoglobus neptunius]|uniref:cyclic dehypoxanthinyl futalosine synthase n=1 Tax=Archaeoglobus neptunius TaxID=2798580 RepID=UPI00192906DE|nr:cyclic dehypoxanthinyl futalosine synthase [Archaeoglobus neptunius]